MLILIAFRHGLRVGELVEIRWDQVDLQRGTLHVNRKKNGEAATHPLSGRELRGLRQLKRAYPESPFMMPNSVRTPRGRGYAAPTAGTDISFLHDGPRRHQSIASQRLDRCYKAANNNR